MMRKIVFFVFLSQIFSSYIFAQHISLHGEISSWADFQDSANTIGFRFIPYLNIENFNPEKTIDAEIAYDSLATWSFDKSAIDVSKTDPYRIWLRYKLPQLELRAGLQKINFGPCRLLRPLMWFDRTNPTDPLKITDGVYGILARYYTLNNSTAWLWTLYGNNKLKGYEAVSTYTQTAEFGGRYSFHLSKGEAGITFNSRRIEDLNSDNAFENKYALDGIWDLGIGVWFESVVIEKELTTVKPAWQKILCIGSDYTFNIGNGLHILSEHLLHANSSHFETTENITNTSAFSLDYNLGILDNIRALYYYSWDNTKGFYHLGVTRTYDKILFYLSAYVSDIQISNLSNLSNDKGIMLLVRYNY
ncbi:MAG: hypothetical protein ABH857_03180 [Elusimicrobiota bacterium]